MENNFKDFDTTPTLTLDPFQTAEEKQEPAVVEEKKEEVKKRLLVRWNVSMLR